MMRTAEQRTMELSLDGRAVAFLAHYMAQNDIRYYLNGIYVAPMPDGAGPGAIAAATNGHVLGMWHDQDGTAARPAIMKVSKPLARACKPGTRLVTRDRRLTVICSEGRRIGDELYIDPARHAGDRGAEPWEVEGTFPGLDRVIHEPDEAKIGLAGDINADYLGTISASLKSVLPSMKHLSRARSLRMRQVTPEGAILALCAELPEVIMVVMPLRDRVKVQPSWLERWRTGEKAAQAKAKLPLPGCQPSDADPSVGRYPA